MHLFVPPLQQRDEVLPLFFNVDEGVGKRRPNRTEDVLLVQFLIKAVIQKVPQGADVTMIERMSKVPVNGLCDDATIDGILAVQEALKKRNPGVVVDGVISRARGYSYGAAKWTIVWLNQGLRNDFPNIWPRLQDIRICPPALKSKLAKIL